MTTTRHVKFLNLIAEVEELHAEIERLREGLRRIKNQDYNMGYSPEVYADAVLTGHEPQQDPS